MSTQKTVTLTIEVPACNMTPEVMEEAVITAAVNQVLGIRTVIRHDEDGEEYEEDTNDTVKSYRARVEAEIAKQTREMVAAIGPQFVTDILESGFTPVDRYGDKGKPTTIRKSVSDYAREWLEAKVDKNGNSNQYNNGDITRLNFIVRQEVERAFKEELRNIINETAATIKPEIARQIREAVGTAINAAIGVRQ